MTETDNSNEATHPRPAHEEVTGRRVPPVVFRLSFLAGSVLFFLFGPQALSWVVAEPQTSGGIQIASLGGLTFLIAFWSLIVGWLLLLVGSRVATLAVAAVGVTSLFVLPVTTGELTRYQSPTLWAWLFAYAILAEGGLQSSRAGAAH